MKVTLERTELLKSLTHVHRVVERRNTIPILSNVMLQAEGGNLKLKATDLDLEVVESIAAMVETPGATTVPAHMIYEIVRKLPDGSQVVLETSGDDSTMEIRAGRSRFALQILPVTDFPDLTAGEFSHSFTMTAGGIRKLIDSTQFAISTEETRYYLNGIYMHSLDIGEGLRFRAVATDGHRLAQAELEAPEGSDGMPGIIVPRKTVGEIQKLLDDPEVEIKVEISETKIRFTIGDIILTSKLIDGTFPDYERVIPKGNDKELRVDRDVFKEAVDRVSTIASDRGRAVKMALSEGKIVLTVTNPDSGTATEEVAVEYDNEEFEIGFNSKYLLDIAAQLEADTALFTLADSGSPTLIRDEGSDEAIYVLMPMRV
ncbi:DNA polymerase III, beta chain [Pseudovibrio sp. FO-BEG1]|uniref:Beta sliding clamp n=1 Tax=Pseudovibrio denitrificans TaxID=258256 RepID=A0A1I7AVE4_9HYPH|nr:MULTISPECIES: DNA polymerase III subunit beta [Pseudovibrio]AEV34922.1 DNA polymerase III, beta chain [Pseudovibrio sp. FO-BEG1]EEA93725.1 DNA polymerase III, beta subunit [Pseudovibrio sp. JE062]SFT78882.1 DNA polymerase III, beta subunit [Pseudovibrio denitrificans]